MAQKAITNDELALMMKRGFDEVDEKFAKVDEKFDKVDEKFEKIDEKFDKMLIRQINLENSARNFVTKDYLDKKIDRVMGAIDGLTREVKASKEEKASNLAAHNRIQGDVNEVRGHVGLEIKHPVLDA